MTSQRLSHAMPHAVCKSLFDRPSCPFIIYADEGNVRIKICDCFDLGFTVRVPAGAGPGPCGLAEVLLKSKSKPRLSDLGLYFRRGLTVIRAPAYILLVGIAFDPSLVNNLAGFSTQRSQ